MIRSIFFLVISFLAFIKPSITYSQDVIDITKLSPKDDIGHTVSLFKDNSRSLDITEINNSSFVKSQKKMLNLGYSTANDWLKFSILNPTSDSLHKIVQINGLRLAETELFYEFGGKWKSVLGGGATPQSSAPIQGMNIYLPFTLVPHETTNLYIRVSSQNSKALPITIIDNKDVSVENSIRFITLALVIGAISMITLYNVFLGFSTGDKLYFHYSMANLFSMLGIIGERGFYTYIFSADLIYLAPVIYPLTLGLWMIFSTTFSVRILDLKTLSKGSYYALLGLAAINFFVIVTLTTLKTLGYLVTYKLISTGILVFCLTSIFCGVIALKKGSIYAKYYLSAWASVLIGVILLILTVVGIIPHNVFTRNFYVMGSICELLILSFALAFRFNTLQKDRNRLKEKLVTKEGDLSTVISDNQVRYQFSGEILKNLDDIISSENGDIRKKLSSYANDIRLQSSVEEKLNFEQRNIQQMDTELKKKIGAAYPNLTTSEIEIFMLMRLNLSIKEIVRIRNSSESAIKSARHRIRKKTNLEAKEIINFTFD